MTSLSLSKKYFRQTAHKRKLKHPFMRSIIFLLGYASRSENDIGSSLSAACPGPSGPPTLKMIHWIIFRALRAPHRTCRCCGMKMKELRPFIASR